MQPYSITYHYAPSTSNLNNQMKRNIVWRVISRMILAGYSAQQAIDKIYEVYGQISVTGIINRLRQDDMAGGNIQLR